jgi:hypothetical protein
MVPAERKRPTGDSTAGQLSHARSSNDASNAATVVGYLQRASISVVRDGRRPDDLQLGYTEERIARRLE